MDSDVISGVGFNVFAASLIETHLSIIGACLPSLRKMFGTFFGETLVKAYSNVKIGEQRYGSAKGSKGISNDLKNSKGSLGIPKPPPKDGKSELTIDDIELTAATDSDSPGGLTSPTDHEYFQRAYVRRFMSATLSEHDLRGTHHDEDANSKKAVFPHTVF
jgi:hypothetical protein